MEKISFILGLLLWSCLGLAQDANTTMEQLFQQGKYNESLAKAEYCIAYDSTNVICTKIMADSANKLGDQSTAKKYYHILEKLDSTDVHSYMQLAAIYEQQQQIPKAIKYYSLLNVLAPENSIFFRKNAHLYRTVKDNIKAFELYATAHKINPKDILTIRGLAELCVGNDQMLLADSLIRKGIVYDPENISMYYLLARSKYKQKQYDSVTLVLEGVRRQVDLNSYYNKLLGYSYLQIDSVDLAIQKLSLALVDDPESEKLHYYLATALEKKGEMEGAMDHYEKAVKYAKSPDLDLYHRNAGRLANSEKKYKQAITHYRDAYRYSEDPVILYYLASVCDLYYKDKSIAINYYKKYVKSSHPHQEYKAYAEKRYRYLAELKHQSK